MQVNDYLSLKIDKDQFCYFSQIVFFANEMFREESNFPFIICIFVLHCKNMTNRKPIHKENLSQVGFIKKAHGIKGEVLVVFENGMEEAVEEPDFILIEIDGLFVPFKVESFCWRGDGSVNLKLKYIETKEKARQYTSCKVALPNDWIKFENITFDPNHLIGYRIADQHIGDIGVIVAINDFGGNIVFSVNYKGNEVLVPFDDELLCSYNQETKTIVLNCPDGLFELNS